LICHVIIYIILMFIFVLGFLFDNCFLRRKFVHKDVSLFNVIYLGMLILCNWEILEMLELGNNQVWKLPKHTQNVWICDNCKSYLHATKDNFKTWNLIWNIVCSSIFPNWQFLFITYLCHFAKCILTFFSHFCDVAWVANISLDI